MTPGNLCRADCKHSGVSIGGVKVQRGVILCERIHAGRLELARKRLATTNHLARGHETGSSVLRYAAVLSALEDRAAEVCLVRTAGNDHEELHWRRDAAR